MAKLYITEYDNLARDTRNFVIPAGQEPALVEQTIDIGESSVASLEFGSATQFVRIHTDAICSIDFGVSPTATTGSKRMAADTTEYFGVLPGYKVAVISNT
jgi:hypothetical protein